MSVNLSIKDVPDALAQALRERAARNHRSLQGELMAIIEAAAVASVVPAPTDPAMPPGSKTGWKTGWKSIEQLIAEREGRGWKPDPAMARLPRGVDLIRADRDSR